MAGTEIPGGSGGDRDPRRYWRGPRSQEVLAGTEIPGGTGGDRDPRRYWRGPRSQEVLAGTEIPESGPGDYTYRYNVTTRLTLVLRWAARRTIQPKPQALLHDILPPATVIVDYATGLEKLSANGQFLMMFKRQSVCNRQLELMMMMS